MPEHIEIRKDIPSGSIIIKRQDRCNALTRRMVDSLIQALEDFHSERRVRAIILTASGEYFSSGTDLHEMKQTLDGEDAEARWQDDVERFLELLEAMLRYPKPIIAAVNGPAVGSGAALVLASDLVVAGPTASLGFPEPQRGLVAGLAAPLLAFRVGPGHASRMILSTQLVSATACQQMGLFHNVVADELLWAQAQEIAHQVATGSHQSVMLSKQLINEMIGEQLFTQLRIGAAHTAAARTTDAAQEGINAFLERRPSDFEKPIDFN